MPRLTLPPSLPRAKVAVSLSLSKWRHIFVTVVIRYDSGNGTASSNPLCSTPFRFPSINSHRPPPCWLSSLHFRSPFASFFPFLSSVALRSLTCFAPLPASCYDRQSSNMASNNSRRQLTSLFFDNKSAITILKNLVFHGRTKHIDIKYHFA